MKMNNLEVLYKIGDRITDPNFGKGTITRLNTSGPIVMFDDLNLENEMCCNESNIELLEE